MSRMFSTLALAVILGGTLLLTGGCQRKVTKEDVWKNPSPAMSTLAHTRHERKNRQKRAVDTTLRQIHDDWDYIWLIDDPIKLTEYPVP